MIGFIGLLIPLLILAVVVAVVVVVIDKGRRRSEAEGAVVSPKDVFVYLLTAATLYISALGLLILIWSLAEYWFPDPFRGFDATDSGGVRVGVAMAIVAFPIFVYLTLYVRKRIRSREIESDSSLRIGFIYFNLFLVAVTSLITLMVTVEAFLGGDLTPRFLVRAGGVLLVAGLVHLYYRSELQAAGGNAAVESPEVSQ